jgi:hypothetical protein
MMSLNRFIDFPTAGYILSPALHDQMTSKAGIAAVAVGVALCQEWGGVARDAEGGAACSCMLAFRSGWAVAGVMAAILLSVPGEKRGVVKVAVLLTDGMVGGRVGVAVGDLFGGNIEAGEG